MSSFCKRKPNKWKRYNAWRAKNRALDQARRLERAKEKGEAYIEEFTVQKCPVPRLAKAWARVRIHFSDGTSTSFSINRTPWGGLNISAMLSGRKVADVIKAKSESIKAIGVWE